MIVGMRDFLLQTLSPEGHYRILVVWPRKLLVPVIRLIDRKLAIPDDPAIVILEFNPNEHSSRMRRLGRELCFAGVPVFDEGQGRLRVYCPRPGAWTVIEAFQFYKERISPEAETLRNLAELGDHKGIAEITGEVNYRLVGEDTLITEGALLRGSKAYISYATYELPEGAELVSA
jgi:hypothetical protein